MSRFPRRVPTRVLLLLVVASCLAPQRVARAADRPNVLMIAVDDMNDWVGCLGGHPDVRTPHIDRLAAQGVLFANAHCAAPVCNPSRVAILTGRRPGTTGIYDNRVVWHEALPGVLTIARHFRDNGYCVVGGGKVSHHMPRFNRRGDWDEYFDQVFDGPYQDQLARGLDVSRFEWPTGFPLNQIPAVKALSKPPRNPLEFDWGAWDQTDLEMGDGRMVEWAVRFLKGKHERPFFLAAGIFRPHLPFYAPRKYFDTYPADRITMPLLKADDLDDLPEAGKRMAQDRREDYDLVLREGKYRDLVQAYLAGIAFADALVGQLLDALRDSGQAGNTIVVFWSDHGWHLGEKQHLHKFTLWERSTHVPFIVVAPQVTAPCSICSRPVGLIDLFPTLNELCALPRVDALDGISLVPLLKEPAREWERPALTTHGPGNHALRTDRWRYIRYANGDEELYDHVNDPHEWNNLADRVELRDVKSVLAGRLPKSDAPTLSRTAGRKQGKTTE
ncbi:MAG: sulfatase [Pirellulaceae bacterium]